MKENYQLGSDDDWLKHSNEELAQMVKRQSRQLGFLRFASLLLLIALTWVIYKYSEKGPLAELWKL